MMEDQTHKGGKSVGGGKKKGGGDGGNSADSCGSSPGIGGGLGKNREEKSVNA
jgi:hypothetical protein